METDLRIESLADVSFESIHRCANRAFSDYAVDVQMTEDQLAGLYRQTSVDMAVSVGAFDGTELVGLWVTGLRELDGTICAYDSGTAICPEYRNRGLASRMWTLTHELLIARGVTDYWLEVLTENEKAYQIYLKTGFEVTRRFKCFKLQECPPRATTQVSGVRFEERPFDPDMVSCLPKMTYEPSWQNATPSMINIKEMASLVLAWIGDHIAGYGVLLKDQGRITQLGFSSQGQRADIKHNLVQRMVSGSFEPEVMAINIDAEDHDLHSLFCECGFVLEVEQYEMKRSL